jgi:hypothetical protein
MKTEQEKLTEAAGFQSWENFTDASTTIADGWHICEGCNGKFVSWCDFSEYTFDVFDSWNEAAESQLEGMKVLYQEFHSEFLEANELEVVVGRNHDDEGRLVGWSFSCDSDGASHGNDESYGAY